MKLTPFKDLIAAMSNFGMEREHVSSRCMGYSSLGQTDRGAVRLGYTLRRESEGVGEKEMG